MGERVVRVRQVREVTVCGHHVRLESEFDRYVVVCSRCGVVSVHKTKFGTAAVKTRHIRHHQRHRGVTIDAYEVRFDMLEKMSLKKLQQLRLDDSMTEYEFE